MIKGYYPQGFYMPCQLKFINFYFCSDFEPLPFKQLDFKPLQDQLVIENWLKIDNDCIGIYLGKLADLEI